ncbi:MAG: M14 family zinc carboxypeptidase [Bacteroidales bacterium]|nr:M14 family zinc carboxypeptidase [Bacteroidales bacterium]
MRHTVFFVLACLLILSACKEDGEVNINLKYDDNLSLEYHEVIDAYRQLADHYPEARLVEMGMTDIGKPLHLFMISGDGDFDPVSIREKGKCIILVNNGIHPGEPEGIDASIQFSWDMLRNRNDLKKYLDNVVIGIIPLYNIGGALDRSQYYRTNQNGPIYNGRRRNARNLDLNRDFAKQETKNARSFVNIFLHLNPDVFLDTHTTNGSDHQYTITLIETLYSKLDTAMGEFFKEKMLPGLYKRMEENSPYGMIPYVQMSNYFGDIKDGIMAYNDHPFYSTGYTALFNCYSFMSENLVYKYFPDRVRSVVDLLTQLTAFTYDNCKEIRELKDEADRKIKTQETYHLDWKIDMSYSEKLLFKGYEYIRPEPVEGRRARGYYDQERLWTDTIPYYTRYDPVLTVKKPWAYIIPQAWSDVVDKLCHNGVKAFRLASDTELEVETYYIENAEPSGRANQGHYINQNVEVRLKKQTLPYYKGDYVIVTNQRANRFIVEMLEPHAPSSYFVWNFFDPILESGDFYSVRTFESQLMDMLNQDDELRAELEKRKAEDESFAGDPMAQLIFIYERSPMYEIEKYNRLYPVARLVKETERPELESE